MRVAGAVLTILLCAVSAYADGWTPTLYSYPFGPTRLLAVDKDEQRLLFFQRMSPLKLAKQFPCTTGQADGDKSNVGDLRTPEGVYFLGGRIPHSLDFELYGDIAYSLNYPNPIDRINGKTGSGIWLHGRGKTLVPRDTRGCVALTVPDIQDLEAEVENGMPVVIAQDVAWSQEGGEEEKMAQLLVERLKTWARDWERRDPAFFNHYDAVRMTLSERRDFKGFIDHKKNVFDAKSWIHVMVDNIQVVRGPDYWVTWFDQYYRTPGMSSTTGKRFYWQQGPDGEWRIVGREYMAPSEDLEVKYLALKSREARKLLADWLAAWQRADLAAYGAFYSAEAVQGGRRGASDIVDYKKGLWESRPPVSVSADKVKIALHDQGLEVTFVQRYTDRSGFSDVGVKTMVLAPAGEGWTIVDEQWRALE